MHRAERDVRLLAVADDAPLLRERLLLPLRLTVSYRSSRSSDPGGSARDSHAAIASALAAATVHHNG
jgi:hypothetical protein